MTSPTARVHASTYLEIAILVYEDIAGFHIAVCNAALMNERKS